jgi:DNA-binding transcriptional ArsR family regulator
MKPITNIEDPRLVKALAHPLRVQILALLDRRTASPKEIALEVGAGLGNVSYHVRKLERLGLLELVRTAPRRGAVEHYYRAVERPTISASAWAQVPEIDKRATVSAALEQVAATVGGAAAAGGFDRAHAHLSRTDLRLDAKAWRELSEALETLLERAEELERETAERLGEEGSEALTPSGLVMLMFEAVSAPAQVADPDAGQHKRGRGRPRSNRAAVAK